MSEWQPISTAPKDGTHILVKTTDFGVVEAWWDPLVINFYKSKKGWASYDPDGLQGDWVSEWRTGESLDARLYCGATPHFWMPLPTPPHEKQR